jgi:phospholipid/cholesterol/gamma-HCH transport system substrate-binding protein
MKNNVIETVLGAVVLLVAVLFLAFSYSATNFGSGDGYELRARFSSIGGLQVGDKVVVSGVKVGQVSRIKLDEETYLADVFIDVDESVQLPDDTAAFISSESLLGGLYMQLEPGAGLDYLQSGDIIQYTQAPQNLEQLLGQFIFSLQDSDESEGQMNDEAIGAGANAL